MMLQTVYYIDLKYQSISSGLDFQLGRHQALMTKVQSPSFKRAFGIFHKAEEYTKYSNLDQMGRGGGGESSHGP